PSLEEVKAHYEIAFSDYGVLAYHPVTTGLATLREEVRELAQAVLDSGRDWVVIYPNNDEGSELILQEYLDKFPKQPRIRMFPSLRCEAALVLLRHARLVLGNSSMGIR